MFAPIYGWARSCDDRALACNDTRSGPRLRHDQSDASSPAVEPSTFASMTEVSGSFRLQFNGGPLNGRIYANEDFAPDEIRDGAGPGHVYQLSGVPEAPPRQSESEPVVLIANYNWTRRGSTLTDGGNARRSRSFADK